MNYKIIFFLLFAFISSNRILQDSSCQGLNSPDQCQKSISSKEDSQCCYKTIKSGISTSSECIDYYENLTGINNFYSSEIFQAHIKEENALYLSIGFYTSSELIYDCKNDKIVKTSPEYTDNEKEIIMNDYSNSCYAKTFQEVENCEDGLLLESSKKSGIECGHALYTIQASDKTISYKTCNLFNINYYAEYAKLSIKEEFKGILKREADTIATKENSTVISFVVEYYNKKGQKMKYDSKTGQFTITISTPIENKVPIKRKRKKNRDWKTLTMMKKLKGLKRYRIIKRLEELKGLIN